MLLRVEAPHFVAGATYVKGERGWYCDPNRTAPILRWMAGKVPEEVAVWLKKKRYEYQWIDGDR